MDILNDILSALSIKLDSLFPNIPIYVEQVPAQVPPRCFLIGYAGGVTFEQQLIGRQRISGKLDITYLAAESCAEFETKRELNHVFVALALHLDYINTDNVELQLRNHRRQDDGGDGVLHDFCNFTTFLLPIDHTPKMNTVQLKEAELK